VKRGLVVTGMMVAFLGAIILFSTVMAQGPGQNVPETATIRSKLWDQAVTKVGEHEVHGKQYEDCVFAHKKHLEVYKIACTECHHVYEGNEAAKKNVWKEGQPVKRCEECHTIIDPAEKRTPNSLFYAFHQNCRGCHRELMKKWKAEGKAAGEPKPNAPTKGTLCHKKKPAVH